MLKMSVPELCADCHQDVGHQMDTAAHPHAAMTEEKACLNCHLAHASDHGMLLRGPISSLCMQCHDQELETSDGGLMPAVPGDLGKVASIHGPVRRGECNLCHQVHGSGNDRLLKHQHSQTYGALEGKEDYALCFSCHDKKLVSAERTHAVTDFRNGDVNLHFVHVNRPKSRSCNICHAPHVAESVHLLRKSFPFGPSGWDLRIDWQKTDNGGTCSAGCHDAFEYDRVTAVKFVPKTDPDKVPYSAPDKSKP
jgi:predicted CXXCH cytochrome family protein